MSFRSKEIAVAILDCLVETDGYPLPLPTLRVMLDHRLRPKVGDAEFDEAMLGLKQKDAVAAVEDEFDRALVKFTIKERGRALLASQ